MPQYRPEEETEEFLAFLRKDRPIRRNATMDAAALIGAMREDGEM